MIIINDLKVLHNRIKTKNRLKVDAGVGPFL